MCDYLVVLVASRVQVAGPIPELLAAHRGGASHGESSGGSAGEAAGRAEGPGTLEDLVLDYLDPASGGDGPIEATLRPEAEVQR